MSDNESTPTHPSMLEDMPDLPGHLSIRDLISEVLRRTQL